MFQQNVSKEFFFFFKQLTNFLLWIFNPLKITTGCHQNQGTGSAGGVAGDTGQSEGVWEGEGGVPRPAGGQSVPALPALSPSGAGTGAQRAALRPGQQQGFRKTYWVYRNLCVKKLSNFVKKNTRAYKQNFLKSNLTFIYFRYFISN